MQGPESAGAREREETGSNVLDESKENEEKQNIS